MTFSEEEWARAREAYAALNPKIELARQIRGVFLVALDASLGKQWDPLTVVHAEKTFARVARENLEGRASDRLVAACFMMAAKINGESTVFDLNFVLSAMEDLKDLKQYEEPAPPGCPADNQFAGSTGTEGVADSRLLGKQNKSRRKPADVEGLIWDALATHYKYEGRILNNKTPIGVRELARTAGVGEASVDRFFKQVWPDNGTGKSSHALHEADIYGELWLKIATAQGDLEENRVTYMSEYPDPACPHDRSRQECNADE